MNSDPGISIYLEIILSLIFMSFAALFVAGQKAIDDVNRNNIKAMAEEGNKKAIKLVVAFEKSNKMIAVMMSIVVLFGFFLGQLIVIHYINSLNHVFLNANINVPIIVCVVIISIISTIIFSVIVLFLPRQIAKQHSQGVALALCGYMNVVTKIFTPFTFLLTVITNVILKIFRQKTGIYEEEYSEENVISMLEIGQESGALKEEGKKMINSIFAFDDKLAYEIMTPRTDVFSIDIQDNTNEFLDELMEMRYSRIPVYDDDSDNIIGILNIKDFLIKAREKGFENVNIREILREAFFVPETKNIDSLFFQLQTTKQHIAILIDEYGGFSGIVTMEDIIEQVMGNIDDEYDEEELEIEEIDKNKYLIDGYTNLNDINEQVHINLLSETSETIGGFVIDILGEIPEDNTNEKITVNYENYQLEVLNVKDRRIEKVILTVLPKEEKINQEIQENK